MQNTNANQIPKSEGNNIRKMYQVKGTQNTMMLTSEDKIEMEKRGLELVEIQNQKFVTIPQQITGDFSETGCFGIEMKYEDAVRTYGKDMINKNCRVYEKVNGKTHFVETVEENDDISHSEESMAKWGY